MGNDKAVNVNNYRYEHLRVLRKLVGDKEMIVKLLSIANKELNPAAISYGHYIAVVVPDEKGG